MTHIFVWQQRALCPAVLCCHMGGCAGPYQQPEKLVQEHWSGSKQAMGVSALRYPGGEEANTFQWAPPPYNNQTRPRPVLTAAKGFPGGDFLFYNRASAAFQYSVMDFDQLMGLAAELGGAAVYVVLNHDSVNVGGPLGATDWGHADLKAAAVAWASYIARKGYPARLPPHLYNVAFHLETHGTAACLIPGCPSQYLLH